MPWILPDHADWEDGRRSWYQPISSSEADFAQASVLVNEPRIDASTLFGAQTQPDLY